MNYKNENNAADLHLVDKVLHGDTNAFRFIIKNTEGLVAQIIFKMVPNGDDRNDYFHQLLLLALSHLKIVRREILLRNRG